MFKQGNGFVRMQFAFAMMALSCGLAVFGAVELADKRELAPTGEVAAATGRDSVGVGHDYAKWRLPNERVMRVTFAPPPPGRHRFALEVTADGCALRDTFGEKPADGWPVNIAPEDVGLKCPARAASPR